MASSQLRREAEGVHPGYVEHGNPGNNAPIFSSTTKFLLGERIAQASQIMDESPHGRHDDELRMSAARLKAETDGIELRFNFEKLTVSCAEDVKSTKKLYELSLERVRTAKSEDVVGNRSKNWKLKEAKWHSRAAFARYQSAQHKQVACHDWHARLCVLNKEFQRRHEIMAEEARTKGDKVAAMQAELIELRAQLTGWGRAPAADDLNSDTDAARDRGSFSNRIQGFAVTETFGRWYENSIYLSSGGTHSVPHKKVPSGDEISDGGSY
eukprot:SAG11_NODE_928_length_6510_cov_5.490251_6_plen_268_part_00